MNTIDAIFALLREHPVEMGILFGFVIYLFRDPIGKVLPDLIKKKLKIEPEKCRIESFYNAKRRVIYDFPERIIIVNPKQCEERLAALVQQHRACEEEVVFNFACTRIVNRHFFNIFSSSVYNIIEENNIGVKIVFPVNTSLSEDMLKLKFSVENAVTQANTKTVQCKTDERSVAVSAQCKPGLILFDDDGKVNEQ